MADNKTTLGDVLTLTQHIAELEAERDELREMLYEVLANQDTQMYQFKVGSDMTRPESRIAKLIYILVGPEYRLKDGMLKPFLQELSSMISLMDTPYKNALTVYYLEGGQLTQSYEKQCLHHGRASLVPLIRQAAQTHNLTDALSGYIEIISIKSLLNEDNTVKLTNLNNYLYGSPNALVIRRAVQNKDIPITIKDGYISKDDALLIIERKKQGKLNGRKK